LSPITTRRALDFASIVFAVLALSPDGGALVPFALLLVAAQVVLCRRDSLTSLLCLAAAQVIGVGWSARPADFARVRSQWEWSRGSGALPNLAALGAVFLSVVLDAERANTEEPGRSLGRALGSRGI
jgi:hypothetical protein